MKWSAFLFFNISCFFFSFSASHRSNISTASHWSNIRTEMFIYPKCTVHGMFMKWVHLCTQHLGADIEHCQQSRCPFLATIPASFVSLFFFLIVGVFQSKTIILKKKEKKESEVAQSCPTLCDPMDCSILRSSIHGIFQARVLEWGAKEKSHLFENDSVLKTLIWKNLSRD